MYWNILIRSSNYICLRTLCYASSVVTPRRLLCQCLPVSLSWNGFTSVFWQLVLMQAWIHPSPPQIASVKQTLKTLFHIEKVDTIIKHSKSLNRVIVRWCHFMEQSFSPEEISFHMTPFRYTDWYLRADLTNTLGKLCVQDTSNSLTFHIPLGISTWSIWSSNTLFDVKYLLFPHNIIKINTCIWVER